MAATSLSTYEGRRTPALYMLLAFRAISQKADRLYLLLGYVCGLELLLLGFFITTRWWLEISTGPERREPMSSAATFWRWPSPGRWPTLFARTLTSGSTCSCPV